MIHWLFHLHYSCSQLCTYLPALSNPRTNYWPTQWVPATWLLSTSSFFFFLNPQRESFLLPIICGCRLIIYYIIVIIYISPFQKYFICCTEWILDRQFAKSRLFNVPNWCRHRKALKVLKQKLPRKLYLLESRAFKFAKLIIQILYWLRSLSLKLRRFSLCTCACVLASISERSTWLAGGLNNRTHSYVLFSHFIWKPKKQKQ